LADGDVGLVAPVIMLAGGLQKIAFPRLVHNWSTLLYFLVGTIAGLEIVPMRNRSDHPRLGTVDGCCFLIRRSVIPSNGLFDPTFFFGGYESTDLSLRILEGGSRIVGASDALVWAERGDRRRSAAAYSYWSPRNRVIFARKNLGAVHFSLFLLLLPLHVLSWIISWGVLSGDLKVVLRIAAGLWEGFRAKPKWKQR
jgi:GT2 family glycosyltransferase